MAAANGSHVKQERGDPEKLVAELYLVRDTFFPKDLSLKKERLNNGIQQVLSSIESLKIGSEREKPAKRGYLAFLRGKALDAGPDYSKEAEEHLSKAVKLDPSLLDAWACLGHCFWKKGDLAQARDCFNMALSKGPHKGALQHLSMLERQLAKVAAADQASLVEDSVRHAKEAVALDVADGQSWYTLGNAYLTHYFSWGQGDLGLLRQCLKAYQLAKSDEAAMANPDLHFNSAHAHRYLEEYQCALQAFAAAAERDPALGAEEELQRTLRLLARLQDLTQHNGRLKPKRMAAIVSALSKQKGLGEGGAVPLSSLVPGKNSGVTVLVKVLVTVPADGTVPLTFIVTDEEGACCALSIYGVQEGAVKEESAITVTDPVLQRDQVEWEQRVYTYPSIRVENPRSLLANGRPVRVIDIPRSALHTSNKAS